MHFYPEFIVEMNENQPKKVENNKIKMKRITFLLTAGMMIGLFQGSDAQKVTLKSGSLDFLNSLTGIRIQEAYANAGMALAAFVIEKAFGKCDSQI